MVCCLIFSKRIQLQGGAGMKKFLLAVAGLIVALLFSACQEITDIGKVHKFPIYPPIDGPVSTKVRPDSSYWLIVEGFADKTNPASLWSFAWGKKIKFVRNEILIDTATNIPKISFDVQVECTYPDVSMTGRDDRVQSFRFKLDSIELNNGFYTERNISNWFELYMKTLGDQKVYYLGQNDFKVEWIVVATSDGIISGDFRVMLNTNSGYQTKIFTVTFDLYYQAKKNK
ncbi:hypothetical protein D9V86_09335 [Bacteroidetes/Chlorobi group bacterium ChocPot_Mid]|nr:MAG: hypothetical protein D9V86_09335 [Bacteroidetes/Chlorobi group bacterium ChocPot_Mid]